MNVQQFNASPWTVREVDFPIEAPAADRARHLVRYAILAPSTKNTQPWRFRLQGESIHILPDLSRWQHVADPDRRELHISLGCALENLIVAADHFGYACTVTYGADASGIAEAVATVTVAPALASRPRMRPNGLFAGLTARRTIHDPFTARAVAPSIRRQLERLSNEPTVRLVLTENTTMARAFDALNAEADVTELGEAAYRQELAYWVGQGVFGTPWVVSKLGQIGLPHLDNGRAVARRDSRLLRSATLVGLISTTTDDRVAQVKAGQLFERVCLLSTVLGLSVHPMSQALQIPTLRAGVARVFDCAPMHAQQAFRIGYARRRTRRHTPRRSIEEVIS